MSAALRRVPLVVLLSLIPSAPSAAPADPPGAEVVPLDAGTPPGETAGPRTDGAAEPDGDEETTEIVLFPAQGINAREILSDLWFKHRALRQRGEMSEASRLVSAALSFMEREGIRTAPEIGAAFLAEGDRALEGGNYRAARENYALALGFDPTLTAPHRGLALALLRGDRDLSGSASELWRGLRAGLADPESAFFLAGNGFLILYLGLSTGCAIALLVLALRSAPALFHDLSERSGGRLSESGAALLGWTLLALPVATPLPPAWALAIWAAIVFAYLRGADRWVAASALVMLLAAGPAARLLAWHFGTAADPTARALIQLVRSGPDLRNEEALRRIASQNPEDPIYPFLLASAYRAGGHFDEAISMYRRVLEIDPDHARAMVNLGNLHALRHDLASAQTLYRRAAQADPTLALAPYNSHLVHLENFSMEAAEQSLREARRVDDALVLRLLARGTDEQARRTPQDAIQPAGEIWERVFRMRIRGGLRRELARALTAPTTIAGGAGLLTALFLPGAGLARRRESTRRCRRCGRAFCGRCEVKTKHPDSCSQCVHLFILRDGLAPAIRDRKMKEVVRYRRHRFVGTRLVSLVLPGSGHVFGGRAAAGLLLLAIWCSAWIGLALRGRLLLAQGASGPAGMPGPFLLALAAALLAWLAGNLTAHEPARE